MGWPELELAISAGMICAAIGFAVGAERLTALLLGIPNVRFARAFPRDGSRLQP